MLSGIIVNNDIVSIDYTNQLKSLGKEQKETLVEAGRTRLWESIEEDPNND